MDVLGLRPSCISGRTPRAAHNLLPAPAAGELRPVSSRIPLLGCSSKQSVVSLAVSKLLLPDSVYARLLHILLLTFAMASIRHISYDNTRWKNSSYWCISHWLLSARPAPPEHFQHSRHQKSDVKLCPVGFHQIPSENSTG